MNNKSKIILISAVIILTILVLGMGFYFYNDISSSSGSNKTTSPHISSMPTGLSPDKNLNQKATTVSIFLIALEDGGVAGEEIGCGDSVVSVERTVTRVNDPLRVAMIQLLSVTRRDPSSGFYNALHLSNLELENVSILDNNAIIKLAGELQVGGICDNPRIEEQLKRTALQFSEVDEVEIYVNNKRLEDVLSNR